MLKYKDVNKANIEKSAQFLFAKLKNAKSPVFLLDMDAHRFHINTEIEEIANKLNVKVAVVSGGKSAFDETSDLFSGNYAGKLGKKEICLAVEQSDCLVTIGYRPVEGTSGFYSSELPDSTIEVCKNEVNCNDEYFGGTNPKLLFEYLCVLAKEHPLLEKQDSMLSEVKISDKDPLTQATFWNTIQNFLQEKDVILAENGTSNFGAGSLKLPKDCDYIHQPIWGSIGFTLGALLGTLLASPERRQLLFIGDGSFQLTAQELSTIIRHKLKPYIFLINNDGYTIERAILGRNAKYNDIAEWNYTQLVSSFDDGNNTDCSVVRSLEELNSVLQEPHDKLKFIEIMLDKHDILPALAYGGKRTAEIDYGEDSPVLE